VELLNLAFLVYPGMETLKIGIFNFSHAGKDAMHWERGKTARTSSKGSGRSDLIGKLGEIDCNEFHFERMGVFLYAFSNPSDIINYLRHPYLPRRNQRPSLKSR
jgi:hypothetical protein